ncbi:MAG: DUF2079 domain-containing protein [Thaumarchaeota archaeon]|nr:DUF2079 domain-containing protein [Nitrososphaerota archaeon]
MKSTRMLPVMIAAYTLIMSYVVLLRYYSFQTHAFDLGIFSQAFSTALHGRLFYETPDQLLIPSGSFLGVHFNLLMFLLLPLYALFPSPQTLLILQTIFVALGAVPIFLVARRIVGSERIALAMALVYLVNPAIISLNFYDFHLEAFLPLFLGMFFYSYIVSSWRGYGIFLALSLITIDFAPVLVVAICFAHALRSITLRQGEGRLLHLDLGRKRALILLGTVVVSLTVFYAVLSLSVFFSGRSISVPASLSAFVATYEGAQAFYLKSEFWMLCLIPLMFLPLLAPKHLVMVAPWFVVTVLAGQYATSYSFGYQVAGAFVVPYLILAAIFGVAKLHRRNLELRGFLVGMVLLSLLISPLNPLTQNRLPGIAYGQGIPAITPHDTILDQTIGLVPSNASIYTQNELFPQVSGRADAYIYPPIAGPTQYVLADTRSSSYLTKTDGSLSMKQALPYLIAEGTYGILVNDDGVLLLKEGYSGPVLLAGPTDYSFNYKTLALRSGSDQVDPSSMSGTVLVHRPSDPNGTTFWFGPYVSLPPGRYSVTFVMKTAPSTQGSLYLQVSDFENASSTPVLSQRLVTQADFPESGSWTLLSLTLDLTPQQSAGGTLEFRGVDAVGGPFSLDYVLIQYVSP